MKQDNSKQRLLEVMQRVDRGFKPVLNEEFGGNTDDPTKEEMVNFIKTTFNGLGTEDMDFDIESAIYWFASDYHGGQWSNLYSVLSTSPFRPATSHSSINDEESEVAVQIYNALVNKYGGSAPEEIIDEEIEEFIPHGSYTVSNSGGYEIMLSDAGDAARVRDAFGSDNPKTSDWLEIEYVPNEDDENGEFEPVIDPNGYNIPLNMVMRINPMNEDDKWIQKAVDPKHKGDCTPMTKDTCTPARKAFAKRAKAGDLEENISIDVKVGDTIMTGRFKNSPTVVKSIGKDEHGMPTINGKKVVTFKKGIENENIQEEIVDDNPEEYRGKTEKLKQKMDMLFNDEEFGIIETLYRLIVERKKPPTPELREENMVYPEEQLQADFNNYAIQQNLSRGTAKQLWSDIYTAWYTNRIHSSDDIGVMAARMNENKSTDNSKELLFEMLEKLK